MEVCWIEYLRNESYLVVCLHSYMYFHRFQICYLLEQKKSSEQEERLIPNY